MANTTRDIDGDVRQLIAEQGDVPLDDVEDNATLVDDLSFDSLDVVELTISLEETFGIAITDEEVQPLVTVGDVISFVTRKVG